VFRATIPLQKDPASRPAPPLARERFAVAVASPSRLVREVLREQIAAYGGDVEGQESLEALLTAVGAPAAGAPGAPRAIFVDRAFGDEACSQAARRLAMHDGTTLVRLTAGHLADRNSGETGYSFDLPMPLLERRLVETLRRVGVLEREQPQQLASIDEDLLILGRRVLLVEDNAVNRMIAVHMLEKMGVSVTVAQDGSEAVAAHDGAPFDLILMDCQMPVMDGFDATAAIRVREAERGSGRVPIVALTASVRESDRERCLAVGMDDFLTKPLTVKELRQRVVQWLGGPAAGVGAA
jgi:CheY-like chemotaxis protein